MEGLVDVGVWVITVFDLWYKHCHFLVQITSEKDSSWCEFFSFAFYTTRMMMCLQMHSVHLIWHQLNHHSTWALCAQLWSDTGKKKEREKGSVRKGKREDKKREKCTDRQADSMMRPKYKRTPNAAVKL